MHRRLLGIAVLFAGAGAWALEPDPYNLGDGALGDLTITASSTVMNSYAGVTANAAAGAGSLSVSNPVFFSAGDLIMIIQSTGFESIPDAGEPGPFDLSSSGVGRWELVRVSSVAGDVLTLSAPLTAGYPAGMSQVVRVPNFRNLTVNAGASIAPLPWNGALGGIVAFVVQVSFTNSGAVSANGAGFRAGSVVSAASQQGCTGLDEPAPQGAQKGEGIVPTRFGSTQTGRGNVANGGGGGVCDNSGGGGGGGAAQGGTGGYSTDALRPVGGMGGGGLILASVQRQLVFGGGGGAGHENNLNGSGGGAGGGIVFIRAGSLSGSGTISANGADAPNAPSNDGAGGGGGGGTVYLRVANTAASGTISANGGKGGNSGWGVHGPGGGGGGGRVLVQPALATATLAGIAGKDNSGTGTFFGAGPTSPTDPAYVGLTTSFGAAPGTWIDSGPARPSAASTSATFFFHADQDAKFNCKLDGVSQGVCASPFSVAGLGQGAHSFEVYAWDALSNADPTPATWNWSVDTVAPQTYIDAGPPTDWRSADANFVFSTNEPWAVFQCSIDGGAFTGCPTPHWISGLPDGLYGLRVRAEDDAGNVDSSPASWLWRVDTREPQTTVSNGPQQYSASADASFTLGSNEAPVTFECRVDGGAYYSCSSPVGLSGLPSGSYVLEARATDLAGNVDSSPGAWSWVVDTVLPDTTVSSGPPALFNQTDAGFTFSSNESHATFLCQRDVDAAYAPCGPASAYYVDYGDGQHTFSVKAVDDAGNVDPTPATWQWTVATGIPDTFIVRGPPALTNQATASFEFSSSKGVVTYECRLDGQGAFATCSNPAFFPGLVDGQHTLEVRATDPAAGADPVPAVWSWSVDTVAAETFLVGVPELYVASAEADFVFSSSDPEATFDCKLDDGAFTPCASPFRVAGLAEGQHTLAVRAVDVAGNRDESPESYAWTVDLTAPETTLTVVPLARSGESSATFDFASNETPVGFECALDGDDYMNCIGPVRYERLALGPHRFVVRSKDLAGNVDESPETATWEIGTIGLKVGCGCSTPAAGSGAFLPLLALGVWAADRRRLLRGSRSRRS